MPVPCALCVALAVTSPDFISPDEAGFADCMIVYNQPERSAERLIPYVAHLDDEGRPTEWLFDCYLFCFFGGSLSGELYYNGRTDLADWRHTLDTWFAPGRDVAALAEAVRRSQAALGSPPRPVQVIFSIHYPSRAQTDFGDPLGMGRSLDLSNEGDREWLVEWYIDEVIARFRAAGHAMLELWGFYWMNEDVQRGDEDIVRAASRLVHERGLRLLWIPYYRAPAYERWRELGFDVAILQPNYAFLEQHGGKIRSDRLIETAGLAAGLGMGVEIEAGSIVRDPRARRMFREYLAFGSNESCGYARGAKAYYQGGEYFRELRLSTDPDAQRLYHEIADFVRGREVPMPGLLEGALASVVSHGTSVAAPELTDGLLVTHRRPEHRVVKANGQDGAIEVTFAEPRPLAELEMSFLAEAVSGWTGILRAEVREAGTWSAAGWHRAVPPPMGASEHEGSPGKRILALPVACAAAEAVRVSFGGPPAELALDEIMGVAAGTGQPAFVGHLALGASYSVSPDVERAYPDEGRLTDGEVSTTGFTQGRSVGWHGTPVVIMVDLGTGQQVDEVVLHCDGGGSGAVHFPQSVVAELTVDEPYRPHLLSAPGEAPPQPVAVDFATAADVEVVRESAPMNSQGRLPLRNFRQGGRLARYVTLRIEPRGWLMISEIEVLAGGRNVALSAEYACWPRPSPRAGIRYADDGVALTDGRIAAGFEPHFLVGWSEGEPEVIVDLGARRSIAEVVVHTLGGGKYGIAAPAEVEVSTSEDVRTWAEPARSTVTDPADGSAVHMPITMGVRALARYVRVRLRGGGGWTMLSEIEVR